MDAQNAQPIQPIGTMPSLRASRCFICGDRPAAHAGVSVVSTEETRRLLGIAEGERDVFCYPLCTRCSRIPQVSEIAQRKIIGEQTTASGRAITADNRLFGDPGRFPDELLHVPGLIGEVMDYTLATAARPNRLAALAGALALQALLASRTTQTSCGLLPKLYIAMLAPPGYGKEHPCSVNARILQEAGLGDCLRTGVGSVAGLAHELCINPWMLLRVDGIGAVLQVCEGEAANEHAEAVRLLTGVYGGGLSALTMLGTDTPDSFYAALGRETYELFSRMLVLECDDPSGVQKPSVNAPPASVVEAVGEWWSSHPTHGLGPHPLVVAQDDRAVRLLNRVREVSNRECAAAIGQACPLGARLWAHTAEQASKLALLYAVSSDPRKPRCTSWAAEWGASLATYNTRRLAADAHRRNSASCPPWCHWRQESAGAGTEAL